MTRQQHSQTKNSQKQTSTFSSPPTEGTFESRPFVAQAQTAQELQQPDLKTSLMQAERYGHHLSRIQPTGISSSTVVQPMKAGKSSNTEVIQMMNGGGEEAPAKQRRITDYFHPSNDNYIQKLQKLNREGEEVEGEETPGKQRKITEYFHPSNDNYIQKLNREGEEVEGEETPGKKRKRMINGGGEETPGKKRKITQPQNFRQTHLGGRADTAKERPKLKITELHDNKFGKEVSEDNPDPDQFKKKYREPQIQYLDDYGGAGLDERVAAAPTRDMRRDLQNENSLPQADIHKFVGKLSEERSHTNHQMWKTKEGNLAGHPGALSTEQENFSHGITKGHFPADTLRAKMVKNEFTKSRQESESLDDTAKKVSMQANIMTVKEMSQPYSQLMTANPSLSHIYHAKYGRLTDEGVAQNNEWSPQFAKAAAEAHNEREKLKLQTAYKMNEAGYDNLLSPNMNEIISNHPTAEDAITERYKKSNPGEIDSGSPMSQAHLPDVTDVKTLDEMKEANEAASRATNSGTHPPRLYRALSDPRLMIRPNYKR